MCSPVINGANICGSKTPPNKGAAANSHRPFSFDEAMKFEYHSALLSPPPVAVAELGR